MIVKSIVLPLSPAAAFHLVTQRISEWWPSDRRLTGDRSSTIMMLCTGRFYERATDGREVELGKVRAWEPPNLILLDFYIGTGPGMPTELKITFDADGDGTNVTVTHGPKAGTLLMWPLMAPRFEQAWNAVSAALPGCITYGSDREQPSHLRETQPSHRHARSVTTLRICIRLRRKRPRPLPVTAVLVAAILD